MRTRTLRTTVLVAVLALTPALASARSWSDTTDRLERNTAENRGSGGGFWMFVLERITAFWAEEGVVVVPGG